MRTAFLGLALLILASGAIEAHDIPNARVDRSIQVTLSPRLLRVDYEVSLAELTLVQDFRALVGSVPGADRREWFEQYGKVVGPLNAKGLRIAIDGVTMEPRIGQVDLVIEDHLRYTFHFEADIPLSGSLSIRDTNYEAGEGTSRLAIRGIQGVRVEGDDLPQEVAKIPIRPIWQMSSEEERRTRQASVHYEVSGAAADSPSDRAMVKNAPTSAQRPAEGLSRLLDRSEVSIVGLCLIAFALGAAHSIQPGHGKSLVAAASISGSGGWSRGVLLALVITFAHIGGVMAVAIGLWVTRSSRYPEINQGLARGAGFLIAAIGLWRLGRHLGGHGEHADDQSSSKSNFGMRGLIGLGIAGGIVPCWDAVVLVLLAEAVGRLALGLVLLCAFSAGMAAVLVAVGLAASRLRKAVQLREGNKRWIQGLGIASSLAITVVGFYLMIS